MPRGSVIVSGADSFESLAPTGKGKVLTFDGVQSKWARVSLEQSVEGVLRTQHGGTGKGEYRRGDLLFAVTETLLETVPIGSPGDVLTVGDGARPVWSRGGTLRGDMAVGRIPYCNAELTLSDSPLMVVDRGVVIDVSFRGFYVSGPAGDLEFSVGRQHAAVGFGDSSITFTDSGSVSLGGVKFESGKLVEGEVAAERLSGVLDQARGGTGMAVYVPGDLVFADRSGKLARLPAPRDEGMVLSSGPGGMPEWRIQNSKAQAPGPRLEAQGNNLFFFPPNNKRRKVRFDDEPQDSSVRAVALGGTGSSLAELKRGALLVGKNEQATSTIDPGPEGSVLTSAGPNKMPRWLPPQAEISPGQGLKKVGDSLAIDHAQPHNWRATQSFADGIFVSRASSITFAGGNRQNPPMVLTPCTVGDDPPPGSLWSDGDDIFFATRRGVRSVLSPSASRASRVVVLPLCFSEPVSTSSVCSVGLPASPDSPVSGCRWKLLRLEVTTVASGPGSAAVQLTGPNGPILEAPLPLVNGHAGSAGFTSPHLFSGEIVSLAPTVDWAGAKVTAYLVIEVSA